MRRVVVVVPEYRTEQAPGGGVSAVADFLVDAFLADGEWDVALLSPRMWSRAPESRRLTAPGTWLRGPATHRGRTGRVTLTYVGADWSEFEFMRYAPRAALDRLLDRSDVVVLVAGTPAVFNVARRVRKPMIAQVATTAVAERQGVSRTSHGLRRLLVRVNTFITTRIDRRSVQVPDIVAVENTWMEEWSRQHGARGVTLLLPGVDTEFFSPGEAPKTGYILSVGRLDDPRKDIPTLLHAYARAVRTRAISQQLVLAGRRPPVDEALELLDALDIRERVSLRVGATPDELVRLYRGADLFAMASSEEGLGIVMQEAMACGIPVVSTATEGAKTVIGASRAGSLVEFGPALVDRLASTVSDYANDKERRAQAGIVARRRAVERFSARSLGPQFVELARRLAG